jgi:hypothetical protein
MSLEKYCVQMFFRVEPTPAFLFYRTRQRRVVRRCRLVLELRGPFPLLAN